MFDFLDLLGLNDDLTDEALMDLGPDGEADDGLTDEALTDGALMDLDPDGEADDGLTDEALTDEAPMDLGPDGEADVLQIGEDFDGDDLLDAVEGSGVLAGDAFDTDGVAVSADAPAYVTFDPAKADPASVVGDPVSAMDDWHWQETDCSCAVASQEFVLEELTGQEYEESVLRDLAEEHGWFDPYGGTAMDDVGNLLEHMGLRVERSVNNTIEDLEECLADGGEVIVGVDSSEVWMGQNDDLLFFPGGDADHAVQVIGIDRTNPDQPMVILNDPGCTNGCGAMLPMDVFMKSWEDSGCFMVEAYA